jgi:hypothetical protein
MQTAMSENASLLNNNSFDSIILLRAPNETHKA